MEGGSEGVSNLPAAMAVICCPIESRRTSVSVAEAVSLPPLPWTPRPWCGLWMNTCTYGVCMFVRARITIIPKTKSTKLFGVPYLEKSRPYIHSTLPWKIALTTNGHGLELATYVTDD